jgi:hypothetical protein
VSGRVATYVGFMGDELSWSAIYRFWDALKRLRGAGLFNAPVLWQGKPEEERSLAKRASGLLLHWARQPQRLPPRNKSEPGQLLRLLFEYAELSGGINPRSPATSYLVGFVHGKLLFKLALINL